jgi:hypothetical protein
MTCIGEVWRCRHGALNDRMIQLGPSKQSVVANVARNYYGRHTVTQRAYQVNPATKNCHPFFHNHYFMGISRAT